jgi:hypothetical protein
VNYLAEGQPLEKRGKIALDCLRVLKASLAEIAEDDLFFLQAKREKSEAKIAGVRPEVGELIKRSHDDSAAAVTHTSQEVCRLAWDEGIAFLQNTVGPDAVEQALEALKKESSRN